MFLKCFQNISERLDKESKPTAAFRVACHSHNNEQPNDAISGSTHTLRGSCDIWLQKRKINYSDTIYKMQLKVIVNYCFSKLLVSNIFIHENKIYKTTAYHLSCVYYEFPVIYSHST